MKKSVISKEPKVVLSKIWAWIILIGLVILDASLDVIFAHGSGLENSVWKPIANLLGISNPLFLTPIVLILFFIVVKAGAFLEKKIDKVPRAEELVLTTLVIVYGVFVLWLISFYFFNFKLFRSHFYLVPILIVVGITYSWWAEKKLKNLSTNR